MAKYCEFEMESLTIGEWKTILDIGLNNQNPENLSKLVEIIQNHTNTDILSMPLSDLQDVLVQFGQQFNEYVKDKGL